MKSHLLENYKLLPKDALQKRYLMFPSKHLPKKLFYIYLQIYTKETIKRDIN